MAGEKVKLDDGGSNTLEFYIDGYSEIDKDFDAYSRTQDATLKHYTITSKKIFNLSVKNMPNSDKDTLKTIYDLRTTLNFRRKESDGSATAQVVWRGDFNLHTPTNKSHALIDKIYEGNILLEEI